VGPNWAEILQAIASVGTLLVATGGICFVLRQIKQVERSIRSNTNERLTSESLEILRFLAEHPETYDYFYNGKEPTRDVDNMLKYATEMIVNYMEHVVLQKETLPEDVQKSWDVFVQDTYARSPLVREHLRQFRNWYQPSLLKMVENVPHPPPSQT
jgi:hypothetical protein